MCTSRHPDVQVTDASRYDPQRQQTRADWTIVDARGRKPRILRRFVWQHVYSHADLRRLLVGTGISIETIWGPWSGDTFDPKTPWDQTITARKT